MTRIPGLYYLAYRIWHRRAFAVARRLHAERPFGLVHQATLCGYREPGYGGRLGVPFVWGPVGGTQNYPWRFLRVAGMRGGARELVRSVMNSAQRMLDLRVRRAIRTADVLLAANSTNARDLAPIRGRVPPIMLETGVSPPLDIAERPRPHDPFRVFWCGELCVHKALPLLLRALAALPSGCRFELCIAGSGPEQQRWAGLARRLGIDAHVSWLGQLTHADTLRRYRLADALVFTSLRDTSGNVVLEALAAGVPVVCLDHQGVRDIVTPECGIKVPVTTVAGVVAGLRDALVALTSDHERWHALSRGAVARARYYSWRAQHERMQREYDRWLTPVHAHDVPAASLPLVSAVDGPVLRAVAKRTGGIIASGLNRTLGGRAGGRCGILLYHRVTPRVEGVPTPTDNVTPDRFRSQLTGLLDRGYSVASLEDLIEAQHRGHRLPARTVAITFDDAYHSVYCQAWPILRELGLPATLFVSTAYLDSADPLPFDRWARRHRHAVPAVSYRPATALECREMAASGLIAIGSHGHLHDDFRGRPDEFRADLAMSIERLDSHFGRRTWPLAFPYGRFDDELVAATRTSGVACAVTTRAELITPGTDRYALGRFNVYQFDTGATLDAKLQGWYSWLPTLEERLATARPSRTAATCADFDTETGAHR